MMDSFDEKRGMVKKLLDMLKNHAASEVSTGLQKPEGEDDMHGVQVEKVEVIPDHEMDVPTPEHDVITHEMNTGGYVDAPEKKIPLESGDGQPDKEGSAHEEATESEQEREDEGDIEPPSMFASFLGKRKKK